MIGRSIGGAALLLLPACVAGPDYAPPAVSIAGQWRSPPGSTDAQPDPRWWRSFGDPLLDALEAEAMTANLSIEQALARVDQARAALTGADANLLPLAEANGSVAHAEQSLNAGLGQLSRYVPDFPRGVDRAQLSVGASWDLDFAGGIRRAREAARADAIGAQAGVLAARIAVAADLADTYMAYRGAQAQDDRLRATIALAEQQHGIIAHRVRLGVAPRSALDQAAAGLADLRASLPPIATQIAAGHNRIAILLGRSPSRAVAELAAPATIPGAPDPAAGVPADILRRRPDILAAEQRLVAANAGIGRAIADYYPGFSLSALIGLDSNRLASVLRSDAGVAQGALGLRWRLFDFGRVDAEVAAARGRERELLAAYRDQVLRASAEVESGFVQLAGTRARLFDVTARRDAIAASLNAALTAARLGAINRDALIDRQRQLVAAEADIAAARADVARAVIACHRAIGG